MKVIILAGGAASRLPKSAKNIPKSLVEIAGQPILEHQLDLLRKYGLEDIRFSLSYRAEQVIKYLNGRYEYVVEPKPLGTGGAIKFASQDLKKEFIVLNGDVLSNINLANFIKSFQTNPCPNTIALWPCQDARPFGLINFKNGQATEFLEKPAQRQKGYINAGFYILWPEIFARISQETFSIEQDIFPQLAQKGQLGVFIHRGYWTDLGTEERLAQARLSFPRLFAKNELRL